MAQIYLSQSANEKSTIPDAGLSGLFKSKSTEIGTLLGKSGSKGAEGAYKTLKPNNPEKETNEKAGGEARQDR